MAEEKVRTREPA